MKVMGKTFWVNLACRLELGGRVVPSCFLTRFYGLSRRNLDWMPVVQRLLVFEVTGPGADSFAAPDGGSALSS